MWTDFVTCLCVFVCVHQSLSTLHCMIYLFSFRETHFSPIELVGCCIDARRTNTPSECAWRCSISPPHLWKYLCSTLVVRATWPQQCFWRTHRSDMLRWELNSFRYCEVLPKTEGDGSRQIIFSDCLPFIIYSTHTKTIRIIEAIIATWLKAFGVETHFNLVWQWWQHTHHCCVMSQNNDSIFMHFCSSQVVVYSCRVQCFWSYSGLIT